MEEIWKDIKGYENEYLVSNLGRIKSIKNGKNLIMKLDTEKKGYLSVKLYKNGKRKSYKVHRLVAIAFIENPYNKPEVNHIDAIRSNNNVNNLEWVTSKENIEHQVKIGNHKIDGVEKIKRKVIKYDLSTNEIIKEYESCMEAVRENGGSCANNISMVCNGKRKSYKGFGYKYKDV